jgi:hypothetical protein
VQITRLAAIGVLAALLPAIANDTLATLGAGGLIPVKTSVIRMESEDLEISIHRVAVRYIFRNTSARSLDVTVAFPLPELAGGLVANSPVEIPSRDPVNFVDFRVFADGKAVAPKVESRAFADGAEITAELRAAGIPISPVDAHVTPSLRKVPAVQARFQKNGWIDCNLTPDAKCWPMWATRTKFYWTQRFPAGKAVEVRHTYSPVVGGSYITMDMDGASNIRPYCGNADALEQIRRLKALHPRVDRDKPVLVERRIQYILTTANNWSGPIGSFHLSIVTDAPDDIVLTCMPELKTIAPGRYEVTRTDFHPENELDVLLLQPATRLP